jgi:hypothetical protein
MDKNQQTETTQTPVEQQLEIQLAQKPAEPITEEGLADMAEPGSRDKPQPVVPVEDTRPLGIGEWMITILFFLLPIVNIVMMALWAFSSKGNIHRKNFSRACLLWLIILLLGYIVAMTVAGYTIFDIFSGGR